jgi:hypothetical protein
MRPRTWHWFWTILATIAGVIGAGAAVYPLLNPDPQVAYLAVEVRPDDTVRVEAFSEPVILTGKWYIRQGHWWWSKTLTDGEALTLGIYRFEETRMQANGRRWIHIDDNVVANKFGHARLWKCPLNQTDFELGIEIRSKTGLSWLRTALPMCS